MVINYIQVYAFKVFIIIISFIFYSSSMISKRDSWELNKFNLFIASITVYELHKLERKIEREFERESAWEVLRLDKDFIFLEKFPFIM